VIAPPEPPPSIDPGRVKRLHDALDDLGYDQLLRAVRGSYPLTPYPPYEEFQRRVRGLPDSERLWFALLLLGRSLAAPAVREQLGDQLTDDLLALGVLAAHGSRLRTPGLGLTSYEGRYVFASLPIDYPTVRDREQRAYIGQESYLLASFLPPGRVSRALDLCSGSGLLGILMGSWADSVLAVDIDPVAVAVGSFNVELNGLAGIVETRQGDLWEPVGGERFDLVVFNAPFVPTPDGFQRLWFRDGGTDGLRVLGPILDGLRDHLRPQGSAIAYLEAFGDLQRPFLVSHLEQVAHKHGLAVDLFLLFRFAMSKVLRLGNRTKRIPRPAYRRLAEEQGATRYYRALLRARPGPAGVRVLDAGRYVR
jgi:SAM-dependent methyltransferase